MVVGWRSCLSKTHYGDPRIHEMYLVATEVLGFKCPVFLFDVTINSRTVFKSSYVSLNTILARRIKVGKLLHNVRTNSFNLSDKLWSSAQF